jgi:HEAT repeat protein
MSAVTLTEAERKRVDRVDALVASGPTSIESLLAMLDDPSWTVRRAVTSSLAALGDDAVAPLCTWLVERRTSEQGIAAAVDALVASMSRRVPEAVSVLLGHPESAVVADAATILGRCRAGAAVPRLAELLGHVDDNVAMAAIEALGAIGGGTVIEPLITVLEDKHFFRTFPALQVLAGTGDPRAIEAIARLVEDPLYRDEAVRALGRTGSLQAVRPIAAVLDDDTAPLIARALADLLELARWAGAEAQFADEIRTQLAAHTTRFEREFAGAGIADASALASVLGAVGSVASASVLAARLADSGLESPVTAALQRLARREPAAVEILCRHEEARTRAFAIDLVFAKSGIPAVRAALDDEDGEVRARACAALARLGAVDAVPALFELLGDLDPRAAHAAVGAINSLGNHEARALAEGAARSPDPKVRRHGLRIAGYLGVDGAFELATAALSDPDSQVRTAAIATLGVIEDPRSDDKLSELADSPDEHVRVATARAAARRSGPRVAALLARCVADDSPWVRYHACQGLGLQRDPAIASLLIARLADPMPHVRIAAIEALARIPSPVAWQTLVSYARSPDPEQQRVALAGLALHDIEGAVDYLLLGLRAQDLPTQLVSLSGLTNSRAQRALAAISGCAAGERIELRDAAVSLLGERTDLEAARALVELVISQPADHPARVALSQPGPSRVTAIADRLTGVDAPTAQRLCAALGAMGDSGAIAALLALLANPNPAARRGAAATLAANHVRAAMPTISRLAIEDPDPEVRSTCAVLGAR